MSIAIHYSSLNLLNTESKVFGIQVAVSNWLKAYFQHSQQEKFNFLIGDTKDLEEVQHIGRSVNLDPSRLIAFDRRFARENFGQFETIFRPDPDVHKLLWQRQQIDGTGFSFCGLAHAISGLESGAILERYCLDPSEISDAIICPSRAIQAAIKSFWDIYSDYLKQRFSTSFKCPVQLPIIPLGIDIERYEKLASAEKRSEQRNKLDLAEDETVLLWVGRLSHAIKAHPLAMFQAAERVAEITGKKVHLIMVGYFIPEDASDKFKKLAHDFCKKAKVTFIQNDDPRFPDGLWAAGDIFLSLIDNMQESFGLTPLEAMAVGLPRVLSDWNGYRDSVEHNVDGFLIPTTQPPPGNGRALSELLLNERETYGGFLAKSALSVAVDQEAAANAIALLIQDKNKYKAIAEKAKARVCKDYSWKNIIPAYENVWKDLAAKRRAHQLTNPRATWPMAIPQAPDPFTMYASFPTAPLNEDTILSVRASTDVIKKLWSHDINTFGLDMMINPDEATALLNYIAAQSSSTIRDVVLKFPAIEASRLWRTLAWLAKLGITRVNQTKQFTPPPHRSVQVP